MSLRFSGVQALRRVSLSVQRGQLAAVIGPNGAGKTSIFNVVSGIYPPSEGSVHLRGEEITGLLPQDIAARGVARTFQNIELFPLMSVRENVLVGRHHLMRGSWLSDGLFSRRTRREEVQGLARVEEILAFLDLSTYRSTPIALVPYGIQKRVEFARALAMEPRLLLLDEPAAGMNHEETEDMARYILDVKEEWGVTQVLVEHDLGMVMDLADEVCVLDFGEVIAHGPPDEVQRDPAVVAAYLGGSTTDGS